MRKFHHFLGRLLIMYALFHFFIITHYALFGLKMVSRIVYMRFHFALISNDGLI